MIKAQRAFTGRFTELGEASHKYIPNLNQDNHGGSSRGLPNGNNKYPDTPPGKDRATQRKFLDPENPSCERPHESHREIKIKGLA